MSLEYNLCDIAKVKSSKYGGHGLFAIKELKIGIILYDSIIQESLLYGFDSIIKYPKRIDCLLLNKQEKMMHANVNTTIGRLMSTYMNDADMTYPKKWDFYSLSDTFTKYKESDKNNTKYIVADQNKETRGILIVIKDIQIGDEMTKKYIMSDWIYFLIMDVKNFNAFSDKIVDMTKLNENDIINNLISIGKINGFYNIECEQKLADGTIVFFNGHDQHNPMTYTNSYIFLISLFILALFLNVLISKIRN